LINKSKKYTNLSHRGSAYHHGLRLQHKKIPKGVIITRRQEQRNQEQLREQEQIKNCRAIPCNPWHERIVDSYWPDILLLRPVRCYKRIRRENQLKLRNLLCANKKKYNVVTEGIYKN
jgi:hypothetical protein